jgi:murein DD-endopeptidase MepM/ murein hydrolase activator NlpD
VSRRKIEFKAFAALAALALGWIACTAAWSAEAVRGWVVSSPPEALQGGVLELRVPAQGLASVEGRFAGEKIPFHADGAGDFVALLGIDLEAKPGPAKVHLYAITESGARREGQIALMIKAKAFPQESFNVPPQFDALSPETLERIRAEREQFTRAFSSSASTRIWERPFVAPVTAEISSAFGYRRIINGAPRAPHTGVDLRAPMATEVVAANHGRIALVGDFFYSGKSVVLDHGGGLYTMYFHLSEIAVEQGAEVRKGDLIALSGMSGRVTGPHLHWAARLNGARIDPFVLVQTGSDKNKPSNPQTSVEKVEAKDAR